MDTTPNTALNYIETLLRLGWTVSFIPTTEQFERRMPDGVSGSAYQTTCLSILPVQVVYTLLFNGFQATDKVWFD